MKSTMGLTVWNVTLFLLIWTHATVGNEDSTKSLDHHSQQCGCEPPIPPSDGCIGAVYFATNNKLENWVIVNCIQPDGTLLFNNTISTRGKGSSSILQFNLDNNLITGDNFLFVANSGSDSVSMFTIDPHNPQILTFVTVVDSHGDFPGSLAYSSELKVLCVSNVGEINNLACFKVTPTDLTLLPGTVKTVGVSRPDPSILQFSVSDIIFIANSNQLVMSVKGDAGEDPPVFGSISIFPVLSGGTALGNPVINNLTIFDPMELTLIPTTIGNCNNNNQQTMTYTAYNYDDNPSLGLFVVHPSGTIDTGSIVNISIPGSSSSGWSKFSPRTGFLYTTDLDDNLLTETKIECLCDGTLNGTLLNQYEGPGSESNLVIESLHSGDNLYTLAKSDDPTSVIHVYSLCRTAPGNVTLIQNYAPDNDIIVAQTGQPLEYFRQGIAAFIVQQQQSGCGDGYQPIIGCCGHHHQPPCNGGHHPYTYQPYPYRRYLPYRVPFHY